MKRYHIITPYGDVLLETNSLATALRRIAREIADPHDLDLWMRVDRAIRGCNEYEVLDKGGLHRTHASSFSKARGYRPKDGSIWARLRLVVETDVLVSYAGETGRKTKKVRT